MAASKSTKRRKVRVTPFTDHLVRRTKPKPNGAPNEFGEAASVARGLRLRVSKTAKSDVPAMIGPGLELVYAALI